MIDLSQFDSLIAMTMYFNNEAVCCNAIVETRWSIGEEQDIVYPYCGQHLQSYIDEACFRWNTWKASQSERFSDMFNKSIGLIVTWNELKLCKVA